MPTGGTLVTAVAARRDADSTVLHGELIDYLAQVHGDTLYWDVPAGYWRVFLLIASPSGGSEHQRDYINPIVGPSVRACSTRCTKHSTRATATSSAASSLGSSPTSRAFITTRTPTITIPAWKPAVALPWSAELLTLLEAAWDGDYRTQLPLLWHTGGAVTSAVRYTYMDVVTRLYAQHFTTQIGEWCRSHGVEYIGHPLEDIRRARSPGQRRRALLPRRVGPRYGRH